MANRCIWSDRPVKSDRSAFAPGGDAQYKSALLSIIRGDAPASVHRRALNRKITDHPRVKASKYMQKLIQQARKAKTA